jgi:hypothetical protein
MKREFLIEEIIFSGSSGEVRGTVEIDLLSGSIDHIDCQTYCFRRDDTDSPTILDEAQRATAREVVEQVLSGESDIGGERSRLIASAESSSPPTGIAPATPILAEYLEAPSRTKPAVALRRRAQ